MNRKQCMYIVAIAVLGMACFVSNAVRAVPLWHAWPFALAPIPYVLIMLLLIVVGRLLPVSLPKHYTLEISFVPVLACALTSQPEVAIVLFGLSTLLLFSADLSTQKITYRWRSHPADTLLRVSGALCSFQVACVPLLWLGLPEVPLSWRGWWLALLFSVLSIGCMLLIRYLFIQLNPGAPQPQRIPRRMRIIRIVYHVFSTALLGMLLAAVLLRPHGYFYVLVFLAPLALARYSFNLYNESRQRCVRTMAALSRAIEIRDTYTQGHSHRVAYYSTELAKALNKSPTYVDEIRVAALLHDIGKMGVSDAVLNKPGALTDEEYALIQQHSRLGHDIIQDIHLSPVINEAVLHHHRRYDGGGYPKELCGTPVPSHAAILAVADTYDAMTSDRPYRKGMPVDAAVREMQRVAGTQLDPHLVEVFLSILPRLNACTAPDFSIL